MKLTDTEVYVICMTTSAVALTISMAFWVARLVL